MASPISSLRTENSPDGYYVDTISVKIETLTLSW